MCGEIYVINIKKEFPPSGEPYFYIGRDRYGNVLSNPFTSIKDKNTLAKFIVENREDSIEKYRNYFHSEIEINQMLQNKINEIYTLYTNGKNVYLGCFCKPLSCHGDIIKKYIENKYLSNQLKSSYFCN